MCGCGERRTSQHESGHDACMRTCMCMQAKHTACASFANDHATGCLPQPLQLLCMFMLLLAAPAAPVTACTAGLAPSKLPVESSPRTSREDTHMELSNPRVLRMWGVLIPCDVDVESKQDGMHICARTATVILTLSNSDHQLTSTGDVQHLQPCAKHETPDMLWSFQWCSRSDACTH